MLFDSRALTAALAFFYAVFTVAHAAIYLKHKKYAAIGRAAIADVVIACGILTVVLWPSRWIWSNLFFVIAMIIGIEGIRQVLRLRPRLWWLYPAGAVAIAGMILRDPVWPILAFALFYMLIASVSVALLLRTPNPGSGRKFTAAMYIFLFAANFGQILYYFLAAQRSNQPGFFFVATLLAMMCCSLGWLLMFYERLIADLQRRELRARRIATRERAANRAKLDFLGMMGHEIRNPLAAALNLTDLVLETDLTAEQKEYQAGVHSSIQAVLRMTEDVLDLSKIESGEITIESRPFDVVELVDGIVRMFRPAAAKKGLKIVLDYGDDLPRHVIGDSGRIRQVITNFLGNAVKFTDRGEIKIRVDRHLVGRAEMRLRVAVSDTGIGIPLESLASVFERSSRAHGSTSTTYGGAGMGLRISKRLIEIMGGRVAVESEAGKGSTFWFELTLPLAPRVNTAEAM